MNWEISPMERLEGSERLILQTIYDLKGRMIAPVEDTEVQNSTRISVENIRLCFQTLGQKGYVEVIVKSIGTSAEITHKGILVLDELRVTSAPTTTPSKVVFKGLRAFDRNDAGFFLELLPGSRGPDGLPECVRFWKYRIEATDPEKTFRVGLMYGPSGCGKSSLMEAGIIPNLTDSVIPVYVEATGKDTEARLLNALRRYCPFLPPKSSLVSTLQKKDRIPEGKKVLIVLDQFEQWIHAKPDVENSELLQAMKECDGERVQCVLMVRDEFFTPVSRFLKQLEIQQQDGRNMQMVYRFDQPHAKKVLTAFGRAFGTLGNKVSKDQDAFLNEAVASLAQDGRVISVRLAFFAEMVMGKPWNPATLTNFGGIDGVGVTFLEETFIGGYFTRLWVTPAGRRLVGQSHAAALAQTVATPPKVEPSNRQIADSVTIPHETAAIPAIPPKAPPPPQSPTEWLLEAVRHIPALKYAIGVVGLVAAAAISISFFFGHWQYALFGGIAVFGGMVIVRIYVAVQPKKLNFNPSLPFAVLVWAFVFAVVVVLAMGVVKLGITLFTYDELGKSTLKKEHTGTFEKRNANKSKQKDAVQVTEGHVAQIAEGTDGTFSFAVAQHAFIIKSTNKDIRTMTSVVRMARERDLVLMVKYSNDDPDTALEVNRLGQATEARPQLQHICREHVDWLRNHI
jgi:hypothetical protein